MFKRFTIHHPTLSNHLLRCGSPVPVSYNSLYSASASQSQYDVMIIIQLMQILDIDDELLFSIVIFQNHLDNYDLLSSECFTSFKK